MKIKLVIILAIKSKFGYQGLDEDINCGCYSDESDDDVVNPLVAGDEDIDSEEDEPEPVKPVAMVASIKPVSDDDDDDDDDIVDKENG